jgi:hypothetical protein
MKKQTAVLFSAGIVLLCSAVPAFAGTFTVTPEPTTILLMGGGLGAILVIRHLRANKK